ncbi:GntR family transcriptional regulator [Salinarimonas sp.]|uniref:GntR family transcriptional regulator n=1 Tax=Salinarimonas sp. TaxID=2766526 RepID=UPI00391C4934
MTKSSAASTVPGDERVSLTMRAYSEIRRRILDNELPAGSIMLEQELALLLDMSRTPVREAMIRLANEGMVEIRPRHGMRVLPISADDMQEIYQILTALESDAAARIADRGLPADAICELRTAVAAMDEALARDDLKAWARADERFHAVLIETCGNRRLRDLVHQFWDQTYRVRMATLSLRPRPTESNRDHLALVEAIERRDAAAAARIHREHRVRAGAMLVDLLRRGPSQL